MNRSFFRTFVVLGPGIAVAATGVGAGDMVAAAVSGARYGTAILWAALFGALIKYALNEGIARWQLGTDTTLLEGWSAHMHRLVSFAFIVYLVLWTLMVAGALMAACGLAAHALIPGLSVSAWGALHSVVAVVLVHLGGYRLFEGLMKGFIAAMFGLVLACAILSRPDPGAILQGLFIPTVPPGSGPFLLGVVGGVGGSVTLLSYGYWIREKNWHGAGAFSTARLDLGAAYLLTGLFGIAIMIIAAGVKPELVTGNLMALEVANRLEAVVGIAGKWIFLLGFWGAVFSSMLGVWQGVPYLFTDFIREFRRGTEPALAVHTRSPYYLGYLLFIGFPPMGLLLFDRPVWIVLIYSIAGALFMPFLAGVLLYLNNQRRWVGALRNGWAVNSLLVLSLVVFGYLCLQEVLDRL